MGTAREEGVGRPRPRELREVYIDELEYLTGLVALLNAWDAVTEADGHQGPFVSVKVHDVNGDDVGEVTKQWHDGRPDQYVFLAATLEVTDETDPADLEREGVA